MSEKNEMKWTGSIWSPSDSYYYLAVLSRTKKWNKIKIFYILIQLFFFVFHAQLRDRRKSVEKGNSKNEIILFIPLTLIHPILFTTFMFPSARDISFKRKWSLSTREGRKKNTERVKRRKKKSSSICHFLSDFRFDKWVMSRKRVFQTFLTFCLISPSFVLHPEHTEAWEMVKNVKEEKEKK